MQATATTTTTATSILPNPNSFEFDWYGLKQEQHEWLVDGLIPANGFCAIAGKPKCGKSTAIRNLVVAVLKGSTFLGRSVDLAPGAGKVLYIHLDRKDTVERVAQELRELGVTRDESSRLIVRIAKHLPPTFAERLKWLQDLVQQHRPNLIVFDLAWQFCEVENSNEYLSVLRALNQLQDALNEVEYKGAVIAALHSRKATNPNDPSDDLLGSTAQRGSFVTMLMVSRNRIEGYYSIYSDQTLRDNVFGELEETIVVRNPDGTLGLGMTVEEFKQRDRQVNEDNDWQRLITFLENNPGCNMTDITNGLGMSNKSVLKILKTIDGLYRTEGQGIKGDPHRYFAVEIPVAAKEKAQ